ncbi:Cupredoxin [Xylogone sp. PMI_703]|nr:Cupredoxin [Xylogone sp. PMI_703]
MSRLLTFFLPTLFLHTILTHAFLHVHDHTFVPDAILRVTAENIAQSCLPAKSTVLVNGTSPGPELRLVEGKTTWIRVYNDIQDQNLTMHWHGLTMAASPFSDGSPKASQWPIPPNHFFDYEINVPRGMAGTYFYHSHVGFQAVAAAGPLIVDESGPVPYHYDEEKIVFLSDAFTRNDTDIAAGLAHNPLIWSGESSMVLINGKGGGSANGTACNASLDIINVEPNKTYRLRFIGGTALSFASLAIEGHSELTVIEADGSYTKPCSTDFLQVGPGQRFSVLLKTKAKPASNDFWIQVESRERPTITQGFAVLRYNYNAKHQPLKQSDVFPPAAPPLTLPATDTSFLEYALAPLLPAVDFPAAAQVTRRVTITVHQAVRGQTVWLQNGYNWTESFPKEPYLVSLYKNDGIEFPSMQRALANNGIDPVTRAFPAQLGEVLEIVIQNTGADSGGLDVHPFHAHGAHYWDLGSGNGTYDAKANDAKIQASGHSPVKRDTTMLYRYASSTKNGTAEGWRAWRIKVTEPGVWMIHCHILEHMLMGMQTVWVMGNSQQVLSLPFPDVKGYLTYGGDVYGNKTHAPSVVHVNDDWVDQQ